MADAIAIYLRERAAGVSRLRAKRKANITDMKDTTMISVEWNALTYAGHTVWNVHAERQGGTYVGGAKRRPRSEWVIQRDTHAALITNDEAEQLLGQLELKAKARATEAAAQRDRESEALLGGLLFAPDGSKWWSESDRYRWERNGQTRSIAKATVEAQVIDQVLEELSSPGFAPALVHATRASLASDTDPAALRRIANEVKDLASQISRTMDLAAQLSDPAPALRKVEELERSRAERALHLQHLEAEAERASWISKVGVADVARVLAGIAADAKEAGRSELLRPVIHSVVDRVEVDPQTLCGSICYRIAAPDKSGVNVASPRGFEPRSLP
jgi:hypothetical protein